MTPLTRPQAMTLARQMHGAFTAEQTRVYLAEHGVDVSVRTIHRWAAPQPDPTRRERDARAQARRREQKVLDRMRTLYHHGVPMSSIARVMTADLGFEVGEWQVRTALNAGRLGRTLRKQVQS